VGYRNDVMHAAVSSLMVAVLAVQTVFGCCWHHAHWHLHCNRSRVEAAAPVKCCHHHQHESPGQPSPEPCQNHDECQGLSVFLLPQKLQIEASHCITAFDIAAIVPSLADGQVATGFFGADVACSSSIEPPLRLHLLHQTLLI
jgi:hypothetical protein